MPIFYDSKRFCNRPPAAWGAALLVLGALCLFALLAPGLLFATPPKATPTPAPAPSFANWPMVRTRNIFSPTRQPLPVAGEEVAQAVPTDAAVGDYAALTGVLITHEKTLAFFSGTRPEYNAVLPLRQSIAGAKIVAITADAIEVERDGKRVTVPIGQTVPLTADARPAPAPTSARDAAASGGYGQTRPGQPGAGSPGSSGDGAPASAAPSNANLEAIKRRMMEKRQQEIR